MLSRAAVVISLLAASCLLLPVHGEREVCACPEGVNCPEKKLTVSGTICECTCYNSEGSCTIDGWRRVKGTGRCNSEGTATPVPTPIIPAAPPVTAPAPLPAPKPVPQPVPQPAPQPASQPSVALAPAQNGKCPCPYGKLCEAQKMSGTGTTCECSCWDSEGKCTAGGWKKTKGDGDCNFEASPAGLPPSSQKCACPVGKQCIAEKSTGYGTKCVCDCWDSKGKCTKDGWKRVEGNESCDFDATVTPLKPEREKCACPLGKQCVAQKSLGATTTCTCNCWDSEGNCTKDGWKRTKGKGHCNFEATVPTVPRQRSGCSCPPGKPCEAVRSIGGGTKCECTCWDANGKCLAGSWKRTQGNGKC